MGICEWTSTEDATTGDPVATWGADGVTPTLAANWAFLNTPANLSVTTSAVTYSVTATVGASANNLAVLIWNDDKSYTANDLLYLSNVQLELGASPTAYEFRSYQHTLLDCYPYYYKLQSTSNNYLLGVGQAYLTTAAFDVLTVVSGTASGVFGTDSSRVCIIYTR